MKITNRESANLLPPHTVVKDADGHHFGHAPDGLWYERPGERGLTDDELVARGTLTVVTPRVAS